MSKYNLNPIKLKIITNRKLCRNGDLIKRIENVLDYYLSGQYLCGYIIESIILREKDMDEEEYINLYTSLLKLIDSYNKSTRRKETKKPKIDLYAHYFIDKSVDMGIKNIHLPLDILKERQKLIDGFDKVGVSCHSLKEAKEAQELGATYISFSHIFVTDCKKGLEPRGMEELSYISNNIEIPVYALGGIDHTNADICIISGASGVMMMSSIMKD